MHYIIEPREIGKNGCFFGIITKQSVYQIVDPLVSFLQSLTRGQIVGAPYVSQALFGMGENLHGAKWGKSRKDEMEVFCHP